MAWQNTRSLNQKNCLSVVILIYLFSYILYFAMRYLKNQYQVIQTFNLFSYSFQDWISQFILVNPLLIFFILHMSSGIVNSHFRVLKTLWGTKDLTLTTQHQSHPGMYYPIYTFLELERPLVKVGGSGKACNLEVGRKQRQVREAMGLDYINCMEKENCDFRVNILYFPIFSHM